MAKKFDTQSVANKFFTQGTEETHDKPETHDTPEKPKKQGRPPKKEEEKLRGYRYNLNLDRDLKDYLHEMAWKNRTSITQYINDLIRADMEAYIEAGGDESEWVKE